MERPTVPLGFHSHTQLHVIFILLSTTVAHFRLAWHSR